jgi:flagellar biosynthesis/type III secretory pathway protein FliH
VIRRIPRAAVTLPPEPLLLAQGPAEPRSAAGESASPVAQLTSALVALLGEELRLRPEHIQSVVERELARVRGARSVELRVHPDDLPLLPPTSELCRRSELRGALSACVDPTIERGGCVLRSNLGEIDARLETRLSLALALLQSGWPA